MKNTLEYKNFEIKSVDFNSETKEMVIAGYAATFGNQDYPQMTWNRDLGDYVMATDTIERGAFAKTISERKSRIAFCQNHDISEPKAKIIELKEDEKGLFFKARISDSEPELKTKIREEIFSEFSIGFQTINAMWEKKTDGTWLRKLVEAKLFEISVVTIARDENSRITEIKSIEMIDSLIKSESNEEKKYKLLQIKSLFENEPISSLEVKKPITQENGFDFDKITFIEN